MSDDFVWNIYSAWHNMSVLAVNLSLINPLCCTNKYVDKYSCQCTHPPNTETLTHARIHNNRYGTMQSVKPVIPSVFQSDCTFSSETGMLPLLYAHRISEEAQPHWLCAPQCFPSTHTIVVCVFVSFRLRCCSACTFCSKKAIFTFVSINVIKPKRIPVSL